MQRVLVSIVVLASHPALAQPSDQPPAVVERAASGDPVRDEAAGFELRAPAAWKHEVRDGKLVFGSDTEAGLILVGFVPNVTYDQIASGLGAQLQQLGAQTVTAARGAKLPAGNAVIVEAGARLADGNDVRARAIGIAAPTGGIAIVGITSAAQIAGLRKHVDGIAQSVRFIAAHPAPGYLARAWWHFHSVGSSANGMSRERTIVLCPDGSFFDSSATSIALHSSDVGKTHQPIATTVDASRASNRRGNGRWSATGDDARGTLQLAYPNGNVATFNYVFKRRGGGDITLNGDWYGNDPSKFGVCR